MDYAGEAGGWSSGFAGLIEIATKNGLPPYVLICILDYSQQSVFVWSIVLAGSTALLEYVSLLRFRALGEDIGPHNLGADLIRAVICHGSLGGHLDA